VDLYVHSHNTPSWRGSRLKKSTGIILPVLLFTFTFSASYFEDSRISDGSETVKLMQKVFAVTYRVVVPV